MSCPDGCSKWGSELVADQISPKLRLGPCFNTRAFSLMIRDPATALPQGCDGKLAGGANHRYRIRKHRSPGKGRWKSDNAGLGASVPPKSIAPAAAPCSLLLYYRWFAPPANFDHPSGICLSLYSKGEE